MTINGMNYRLTKHGRKRFLERVGAFFSDAQMIQIAVAGTPGCQFVWKPEARGRNGLRLVTVLKYP